MDVFAPHLCPVRHRAENRHSAKDCSTEERNRRTVRYRTGNRRPARRAVQPRSAICALCAIARRTVLCGRVSLGRRPTCGMRI